MQDLLNEILFEKRNKEYGSYQLRKNYLKRLGLSLGISLGFVSLLILGYFIYLNTGGNNTVYPYTTSFSGLKTTETSVLDPTDLAALLSQQNDPDLTPDEDQKKPADVLHNFEVNDNPKPDTFVPPLEEIPENSGGGSIAQDSAIFGGFLSGSGEGMGSGNDLDRFPEFPGGSGAALRYIELTVNYPLQAVKQKLNGVVILSFDVNKQGMVDNVQVKKSIHPMLDQEAIKAIKGMPKWKPGLRHGQPVIVRFLVHVRFMQVS